VLTESLGFGGALLFGLSMSAHCGVMCGALALGLGCMARTPDRRHWLYLAQAGRLSTYVALGLAVNLFGGALFDWLPEGAANVLMRLILALSLLLAAALLLDRGRLRAAIEAPIARWIRPRLPAALGQRSSAYAVGLAWGLLPCAPLYALLVAAVGLQTPAQAGLLLLGFGLGTLPAVLLVGCGARKLAADLGALRWVTATALLLALAPTVAPASTHRAMAWLVSCVS
jgi:sulfite exporter TauE/SafE